MAPVASQYDRGRPHVSYHGGATTNNNAGGGGGVPLNVILEQEPTAGGGTFAKHGQQQNSSLDSTASENSSLTTDSDQEDYDDDSYGSEGSGGNKPSSQRSAQQLLERAQARLQLAEFESKINDLKEELMEKNEKINTLTLQLRRATASKCDLVVACSDIESQKLSLEEQHGREERKWKQMPLREQEVRAEVEKEFMNELSLLMDQMNDLKRRHGNQLLEKDFEIAQLQEKLRRKEMGEDV